MGPLTGNELPYYEPSATDFFHEISVLLSERKDQRLNSLRVREARRVRNSISQPVTFPPERWVVIGRKQCRT
jgi:hypothetical protein